MSINPETERVELPGITEIEVRSPEEMMRNFYWGSTRLFITCPSPTVGGFFGPWYSDDRQRRAWTHS